MVIALCILGVVALLSTMLMMFIFVHSGNISRAEEEKFKDSIDKEFNKK